jgi:putative acetyltransferase
MPTTISAERTDTPDALVLIDELQTHLESFYPPESRHGFSVERLIKEGVAFFVLRVDGAPAGCGGIKLFGREYGELKRMYVRPDFRGRKYGELLVDRLAEHARAHGVTLLRLETGIHQQAAIRLAHPTVRALHRRPAEPLLREVARAGLAINPYGPWKNSGTNQTAPPYALTAPSITVAARSVTRGERYGEKIVHTRKVRARSGAMRILSTENPAHVARGKTVACRPTAKRIAAVTPVTATARPSAESTVQKRR